MNYELVNYRNMVKKFALDYLGEDVPIRVLEIANNLLCIFDPSTCRYYDASVEGICQIKEDRDELYDMVGIDANEFTPYKKRVLEFGDTYTPKVRVAELNLFPSVKEVIFNGPATIVFWSDCSKTVVRAENEPFDKEKGLAMAIAKKALGNKGNYFEIFKKYCREE